MNDVLIALSVSVLEDVWPKKWATTGRNAYLADARKGYPDLDEKELDKWFYEGIKKMSEQYPKQYAVYEKTLGGEQRETNKLPWEQVELRRGVSDGETVSLVFSVGGKQALIDCTMDKLRDPLYIASRLENITLQEIECPYRDERKKRYWFSEVVIPWLTSDRAKIAEQRSLFEGVEELVREYMTKAKEIDHDEHAYEQTKLPVREGDVTYIPFNGCLKFVQSRGDNVIANRLLSNVLKDMGATRQRKGKSRQYFFAIYEDIQGTEAGRGEDDAHRQGSLDRLESGWDGFNNDIREEEYTGHQEPNRDASRGSGEASDSPDDPRSVLQGAREEEGGASDTVPF